MEGWHLRVLKTGAATPRPYPSPGERGIVPASPTLAPQPGFWQGARHEARNKQPGGGLHPRRLHYRRHGGGRDPAPAERRLLDRPRGRHPARRHHLGDRPLPLSPRCRRTPFDSAIASKVDRNLPRQKGIFRRSRNRERTAIRRDLLELHPLLPRIERHLRRTGLSASTFGREAVGDPRLVADLRCGRYLRPWLARRVEAHLAAARPQEEKRR